MNLPAEISSNYSVEKELHSDNLPAEILTPKELRMEVAGATREAAYKALVDGLTSEVMVLDKFGGEHTAPDTNARLRASELILKMRGDIKPDNAIDNRTVSINITNGDITELTGMIEDVRKQLASLGASGQQTGEIIDVEVV